MVAGVAIRDARAMIAALADPETLLVFGVLAARTSKLGMSTSDGTRSTTYVTPYGLMRETSLSRDVVEAAAERLKRAGLLEVLQDDDPGKTPPEKLKRRAGGAKRRRGKQPGAPGANLAWIDNPTTQVDRFPQ